MKNYILKYGIIFFLSIIFTQVTLDSEPQIFRHELSYDIPIFKTKNLNFKQLEAEKNLDYENKLPYKFGHNFDVDINFFENAAYEILDNGDKVYRLQIESEDAYSINFIFNNFALSEGTQLYIYNQNLSHIIGAFTDRNNKYHKVDLKKNNFNEIDLIIVNFYPFEKILNTTKNHSKIIESIDITHVYSITQPVSTCSIISN